MACNGKEGGRRGTDSSSEVMSMCKLETGKSTTSSFLNFLVPGGHKLGLSGVGAGDGKLCSSSKGVEEEEQIHYLR